MHYNQQMKKKTPEERVPTPGRPEESFCNMLSSLHNFGHVEAPTAEVNITGICHTCVHCTTTPVHSKYAPPMLTLSQ